MNAEENKAQENKAQENKNRVRRSIQVVWTEGNLAALPDFWTADCVNHAMPAGTENRGLALLYAYHEQFMAAFSAFSDMRIEIMQQVAEADRVVTHMLTRGRHTGAFLGIASTGKEVSLATIRIDRFQGDKITEHWSVADMAGLMQQLQAADAGM